MGHSVTWSRLFPCCVTTSCPEVPNKETKLKAFCGTPSCAAVSAGGDPPSTTSGHGAASQLALFQLTALKGLKDRWNHGVGIPTFWGLNSHMTCWHMTLEMSQKMIWMPSVSHMKQLCRMASWVCLGVQLVASAALPSTWNRFNLDSPCRHPALAASKTTPNC